MAYARSNSGRAPFGKKRDRSDVYVFGDGYKIECVGCRLQPEGEWYASFYATSRAEMVKHLQQHRQVGQKVPWHATRRLKREIRKIGDEY
jgi:hypothetical protein